MTVEVYSGPGTSAYQSTRYAVAVNGVTAYVYGYSRVAVMPTQAWSAGATVEPAWFQFGADETATVAITRLAGAITSAVVYPKDKGVTQSIAGGVLTLRVPTNVRLWVECNGDRVPLIIQSRPLKPALPSPRTDWTATPHLQVVGIDIGTKVLTLSSSHGWAAGDRVVQTTTTTFPNVVGTAISATEVYYVINPSGATLQLARTPGGTAIDFTSGTGGTWRLRRAMWTDTVNALHFPAGVHTIGRNFKVGPNTALYVDGGAVLVGSLDVKGSLYWSMSGAGQFFCTYALWADIVGRPFLELVDYSPINGYDGVNFFYDSTISGIMFAAWPFFFAREGATKWEYCLGVSPWNYNNDGFDCSAKIGGGESLVQHSLMLCGDDTVYQDSNWFSFRCKDCFLVNSNGGTVLYGYWGEANGGKTQTLEDCDAISIVLSDEDLALPASVFGGNSVLKLWNDNSRAEADAGYGRFNIIVDGLKVWGPFENQFLTVRNWVYPFPDAGSRDGLGDVQNIQLRNIWVESVPGQMSDVTGFDWMNTPHDIVFENVVIGGTRLTAWNWSQFFERNAYPYNIFVEGQPVVTAVELCNRALAYIGESPYVVSISPPDDSKAAKLCAKFFTQAFNEVAQGHEWAWSTERAALVEVVDGGNDFWSYCYEIPAGMLRAIEVLPKGAPDGFRDHNGNRIGYRIERDANGAQRIYSNLPEAWLRYSVYVTDPNLLDPWAQEAVVMNLAAKLVSAIQQGAQGQNAMLQYLQVAQQHIARAKANDGNQRVTKTLPGAGVTWLEGRE